MGAAFYGAGLSRQFRTKDIRVRDILAHGISLSHNATLHRAGGLNLLSYLG
jgi:hypoxia up-regulated 1